MRTSASLVEPSKALVSRVRAANLGLDAGTGFNLCCRHSDFFVADLTAYNFHIVFLITHEEKP